MQEGLPGLEGTGTFGLDLIPTPSRAGHPTAIFSRGPSTGSIATGKPLRVKARSRHTARGKVEGVTIAG
jgi:hypothetical protein